MNADISVFDILSDLLAPFYTSLQYFSRERLSEEKSSRWEAQLNNRCATSGVLISWISCVQPESQSGYLFVHTVHVTSYVNNHVFDPWEYHLSPSPGKIPAPLRSSMHHQLCKVAPRIHSQPVACGTEN
jgi:hypothetical protein